MKIRAVVVALAATAAVAYAAVELYSYRSVLQTNRAQWLVNQGKWDEARQQLEIVRKRHPGNERARRLQALVLLNSGRYDEAEQVVREMPDSGAAWFLKGALAYNKSQDAEALAAFEKALADPEEIEPWMKEIAQLAGGKLPRNRRSSVPGNNSFEEADWNRPPLERLLWHGLAARSLYKGGEFEQSRIQFSRAWTARDRNRQTMIQAAVAEALAGDYAESLKYVDRASSRSLFLTELAAEAERLTSQTATLVAPTIQESLDAGAVRQNALRSAVWARLVESSGIPAQLDNALAAAQKLAAENPTDSAIGLLLGDALEAAGRLTEAYEQFQRNFSRAPMYPALLRMLDLAGPMPQLKQLEAEFLRGAQVVTYVPAEALQSTETATRRGYVAFLDSSSASLEFSVPEDGEYQIALVASGDRAFGLGPVAALWLDGRRLDDIYIAREGWDVYPLRVMLPQGDHSLRIAYVNDSERRPLPVEDRNLYLRGVLVTRAGGQ